MNISNADERDPASETTRTPLARIAAIVLALSLSAGGASAAGAAATRTLSAGHQSRVTPDVPLPQSWGVVDFLPGYVMVDGHLVPVCCIPDPSIDDLVDERILRSGDSIVQFVDGRAQAIEQVDLSTGAQKTFAQIAGLHGVAVNGASGDTYALAPGVLLHYSSAGVPLGGTATPVALDSIAVLDEAAGYAIAGYGSASGMLVIFDGHTLAVLGTMQMPSNLLPRGATVRVAADGPQLLLHTDGLPIVVSVEPTPHPWRVSSVRLAGVTNAAGIGADLAGDLYVSINGKLAAFNPAGRPVRTPLSGIDATPHFNIGR